MTNATPFVIGQKVAIVEHKIAGKPSFAEVGEVRTVTGFGSHAESPHIKVDGSEGLYHHEWFAPAEEAEEAEEAAPQRPLIDFSSDSRATARDYARSLVSRVNKPETNTRLTAVADGKQVDAYDLAEALLDASRHVATRFGQSMTRRKYGERVAHLGYITHAVLGNHGDGLPAYEQGDRSRKVETLEGEVAALTTAGRAALDEVDRLTEDLRQAKTKAENYRLLADNEVTRLLAVEAEQKEELRALEEKDQALTKSLDYALGLLAAQDSPIAAAQVLGFMDAQGIEITPVGGE